MLANLVINFSLFRHCDFRERVLYQGSGTKANLRVRFSRLLCIEISVFLKKFHNFLQILTGKGVEWSYSTNEHKFKYNDLHLWANEQGHVTMQRTKRYHEHVLVLNSSFSDILDETVIYYKNDYRNFLQK